MAPDGLQPEETPCQALVADMYDSPPESFLLSEEAKIDWLGSNAFFHRKDSVKSADSGNNNNNNNNGSMSSNPRSADFESRACSIIGLPKLRRPSKKDHRRNPSVCLFPKPDRSNSIEPRSPKVTCIGRVRSRRGRNRAHHPEEPVCGTKRTRIGWLARLGGLFLSGCKEQQAGDVVSWSEPRDVGAMNSIAKQKQRGGMEVKPGPPGLAETKRIAAGRRSASWGNDLA